MKRIVNMLLEQLLILYIFIFFGWLFGKRKPELLQGSKLLSFLLVNLLLPSKVFLNLSKSFTVPFFKENYITVLISVSILVLLSLLAIPLSSLLSKKSYEKRVYRYSFVITNYAYMGYTLIENAMGKSALANMMTFCIPFAIYTYTFGYVMLTGNGRFWKKLFNPMMIATALGCIFGLCGANLPSIFSTALSSASACVGPLSMLQTGLVLASFSKEELLPDKGTLAFVGLRLFILPAGILGICKLLSLIVTLPAAVYPFAVLVACMPCGLNTVVFPRLVGEDCRQGARMVLYSHAFSVLSIPLWIFILM